MKKVALIILLGLLVSCSSVEKSSTTGENNSYEGENSSAETVVEVNEGQTVGDLVFYEVGDWETAFKSVLESQNEKTQYSFLDFEKDLTPELIINNENELTIYKYQNSGETIRIDIPEEYIDLKIYFYSNENVKSNLIAFGDVENNYIVENKAFSLHNGKLIEEQKISFSQGTNDDDETSPENLHELKFYNVKDLEPIENYYGEVVVENDDIIIWANDKYSTFGDEYNYDLMRRSLYIQYKDTMQTGLIADDFDQPVYNTNTNTLAYIIGYEWEVVGSMIVYDVEERTLKTANLDINEDDKPSYIGAYDDYILFVNMYSWGTVAQGGNINVYDIENDMSYPLVVSEESNIQIVDFEVKDDVLEYNFVKFDENMNLYDTITTSISLEDINTAIETQTPIVHENKDDYIRKVTELDYDVYLSYADNDNVPERTIIEDTLSDESESGVLLWSDSTLYDVKIIGLNYVGNTLVENVSYEDEQEFGTVNTDEAILLKRTIPEGVPYWALSFKNEEGEETRLVLTYDGSGFFETPRYMIIENK